MAEPPAESQTLLHLPVRELMLLGYSRTGACCSSPPPMARSGETGLQGWFWERVTSGLWRCACCAARRDSLARVSCRRSGRSVSWRADSAACSSWSGRVDALGGGRATTFVSRVSATASAPNTAC